MLPGGLPERFYTLNIRSVESAKSSFRGRDTRLKQLLGDVLQRATHQAAAPLPGGRRGRAQFPTVGSKTAWAGCICVSNSYSSCVVAANSQPSSLLFHLVVSSTITSACLYWPSRWRRLYVVCTQGLIFSPAPSHAPNRLTLKSSLVSRLQPGPRLAICPLKDCPSLPASLPLPDPPPPPHSHPPLPPCDQNATSRDGEMSF